METKQISVSFFIVFIAECLNSQRGLNISLSKIKPQAKLKGDLSLDSLNIATLHLCLEQYYGVSFELDCSEHSIIKDLTVEELRQIVAEAMLAPFKMGSVILIAPDPWIKGARGVGLTDGETHSFPSGSEA